MRRPSSETTATWLISLIVYIVYRAMGLTYRYIEHYPERLTSAQRMHIQGKYIIALWHKNIFTSIQGRFHIPHITMASRSKDGEIIARVLERFHYMAARGSSSKGGKEAMKEMILLLRNPTLKLSAALTVDGPRGPAFKVKGGIIQIAKQTSIPILPFAGIATRAWKLRSWDGFLVPKPFSTIHLFTGHPILVPTETTEEQFEKFQILVNNELNTLEQEAQTLGLVL